MEKWREHCSSIIQKNYYFLRASPVSTSMALIGTCLGPLLTLLLKSLSSWKSEEDLITFIPYFSFSGAFAMFYMVLRIAVVDKETRSFLALRRLGIFESAYWVGIFLTWLPICLVSSLLGTIAWKVFLPQNWIGVEGIPFFVLFMILLVQNLAMAAAGQTWSGALSSESSSAMVLILYWLFNFIFFWTSFRIFDYDNPGWYLNNKFYQFSFRALYAFVTPLYTFGKIWTDIFLITYPSQFNGNVARAFTMEDFVNSVYRGKDFSTLFSVTVTDPLGQYPSILSDLGVSFFFMFVYLFASWQLNYAVPYDGFALPFNFFLRFSYWGKIRTMQGILSRGEEVDDPTVANVRLEDVSKFYYGGVKANRNITTLLEPGNVYGILGQNGAGKSTFVGLLTGWSEPTKGTVTIWGHNTSKSEGATRVRTIVGYVPQYEIVFPNMTAMQHIAIYATLKGVEVSKHGGIREYALSLLKKVALEDYIDQNVDTYSGGMQRRLSFILGSIGDVRVLLLDEPCTGLDPISRALVWKEIEELKKTRVVVLTTHDMEEAEYLSDKILMLADGVLIAEGSPLAIKDACGETLKLHITKRDPHMKLPLNAIADWAVSCIPGAKVIHITKQDTELGLPRVQLPLLNDFSKLLETEGILNWSLQNISMEEAFLTLLNLNEEEIRRPEMTEYVPGTFVSFAEYLKNYAEVEVSDDQSDIIPEVAKFSVKFRTDFWQQFASQRFKIYNVALGNWVSIATVYIAFVVFLILLNGVGKFLKYTPEDIIRFALILSTPFFSDLIINNRSSGMLALEKVHGLNQTAFWPALYYACFVFTLLTNCIILYPFTILRGVDKFKVMDIFYILGLAATGAHAAGTSSVFFGCIFRSKLAPIFIWTILVASIMIPFRPLWSSLFPFVAIHNFLRQNNSDNRDGLYWHFILGFLGGFAFAIIAILIDLRLNNKPKSVRTRKVITDLDKNPVALTVDHTDAGVEKALQEIYVNERDGIVDPREHIRISDVSKKYGNHFAVKNLSVRLFKNETFVLLGQNGAGKSTTFSMIQRIIKPTSGTIKLHSKISICKQADFLWDNISTQAHLEYFSLVNGVPKKDIPKWIEKIISFGILDESMLIRFPIDMSGGMRRRLSVAISMCGDADVLLLDEPSTGLDPKNRYQLWEAIHNIRKIEGKSVILSTHAMQEADALSDRIGVLKNGRLIALGTKSELNLRYGNKFKVNFVLILKNDEELNQKLTQFKTEVNTQLCCELKIWRSVLCPRANGTEIHCYMCYEIFKTSSHLPQVFAKINAFCKQRDITEWDINETSSEDIFFELMRKNTY